LAVVIFFKALLRYHPFHIYLTTIGIVSKAVLCSYYYHALKGLCYNTILLNEREQL